MNDIDREPDADPQPVWSRLRQDIGVIIWSSFLAACVATLFFFAAFDPLLLGPDDAPPPWLTSRMAGYGFGFFFFWVVCAVAASIAISLLHLPAESGRAAGSRD